MSLLRPKNLLIGLFLAFILLILIRPREAPYPVDNPGLHTSFPLIDSDQSYSSSKGSRFNSNLNRHEVLQKKVKGYRESTYWGVEHPIHENTKDLSDDEFKRFIKEEVEPKDEDVYWGAEY